MVLFQAEDIKTQAEEHRKSQVNVFENPQDIMTNSDIVFNCVTDTNSVKEVSSAAYLYLILFLALLIQSM